MLFCFKKDDVQQVPHWGRVAFAVRCVYCVAPLFHSAWPQAMARREQALREALRLAEESALEGRAQEGLENAVLEAVMTAGAALCGTIVKVRIEEPVPKKRKAALIASFVAKAAEHAAEAARVSPLDSAAKAARAVFFAAQAASEAGRSPKFLPLFNLDLAQIFRRSRLENWTDSTPMPRDLLG
jgi:hypothetical protein